MRNFIFFILSIFFIIISCSTTNAISEKNKADFEISYFDAVSKELVLIGSLPEDINILIEYWFNNKVKVEGIEGNMIFKVQDYLEEISTIEEGKRVDVSIEFEATIKKSELSHTKKINGKVNSFSEIVGSFSLKEFDKLIEEARVNLITRLSKEVSSRN